MCVYIIKTLTSRLSTDVLIILTTDFYLNNEELIGYLAGLEQTKLYKLCKKKKFYDRKITLVVLP